MESPNTQSVTRLIRAAQQDRASAVGPLLAVYFERLVQLARRRLQDLPGMAHYDEDLALRSFYICDGPSTLNDTRHTAGDGMLQRMANPAGQAFLIDWYRLDQGF